jgi:endonuclease YncB( thermonuclease family)
MPIRNALLTTRGRRACGLLALAAALTAAPAVAAELRAGGAYLALGAREGDVVNLAGAELRLSGILAPRSSDRGSAREVEGAAAMARTALERLVRGQTLRLWHEDVERDRHGRFLAHARLGGGLWVADELLRQGHARVFTQPGQTARVREMLAVEAEARAAKRGLWALPSYAIRDDRDAARATESFQLVEGRVLKAAQTRDLFYLNFGEDYARDFTVGLDRAVVRAFRRAGVDPATLAGKRIRVRGWVLWRGGPYIGATHPEQVEIME